MANNPNSLFQEIVEAFLADTIVANDALHHVLLRLKHITGASLARLVVNDEGHTLVAVGQDAPDIPQLDAFINSQVYAAGDILGFAAQGLPVPPSAIPEGMGWIWVIPLASRNHYLGNVWFGFTQPPDFSDDEQQALLLALKQVALAVANRRQTENMMMFLQTVSHDLRSPLTAAKGFVDMIPMVGDLNNKQTEMREKVITSIIDMTNLVEKVLDAGRLDPEMGAYELRRDACDPRDLVNKVASNLASAAQKKSINLRSEIDAAIPVLFLDPLMLERALVNLVENAIKYTPDQGEVTVQAELDDDSLVLSVADNGLGIPPEKQATIFDRGSRIRRAEHRTIRGSGLGLFIVKNVARQHHGDVFLSSEEGKGSIFRIVIPLQGNSLVDQP